MCVIKCTNQINQDYTVAGIQFLTFVGKEGSSIVKLTWWIASATNKWISSSAKCLQKIRIWNDWIRLVWDKISIHFASFLYLCQDHKFEDRNSYLHFTCNGSPKCEIWKSTYEVQVKYINEKGSFLTHCGS